jgi:hypothetical protein
MILGCVSSNHNRASMLLREECHMLKKFLKSFSGNSAIPIRHKIKKKPAMSERIVILNGVFARAEKY